MCASQGCILVASTIWTERKLSGKYFWNHIYENVSDDVMLGVVPELGLVVDYMTKFSVLFGFLLSSILQIRRIRCIEKNKLVTLNKFSEGWTIAEAAEYYASLQPVDETQVKWHFRHVELAAWYANKMKMDDQVVRDAGYVVDFAIIGQLGLNKATFHQALDDCGRCQRRLSWHLWHKYLGSRYNWAAKMGRIMFSDGKWASVVRASSFVDEKDRAFLMQFRKHLRIVHACVLCGELFGVYIVASLFYAGDSFVREPGAA